MTVRFSEFLNEGKLPNVPAKFKEGDIVAVDRGWVYALKRKYGNEKDKTYKEFWSHDGCLVEIKKVSDISNSKRWIYEGVLLFGQTHYYIRNDPEKAELNSTVRVEESECKISNNALNLIKNSRFEVGEVVTSIKNKLVLDVKYENGENALVKGKIKNSSIGVIDYINVYGTIEAGECSYSLKKSDGSLITKEVFPESSIEKNELPSSILHPLLKKIADITNIVYKIDKDEVEITKRYVSLKNLFNQDSVYFATEEDAKTFLRDANKFLQSNHVSKIFNHNLKVNDPYIGNSSDRFSKSQLLDIAKELKIDVEDLKHTHRGETLSDELEIT